MEHKAREITVSNRTIVRVVGSVVLVGLFIKFVGNIIHPLTLIFVSFFLAMALNPIVGWISRQLKIKSRAGATAIAYLSVVIFLASFFGLVVPPLVSQTKDFISDAPRIVNDFRQQDSGIAKIARHYKIDQQLEKGASDISKRFSSEPGTILSTSKRIGSTFISIVTVFVLTFMMLVEGPLWLNRLWLILPKNRREHQKNLAGRMYKAVTAFVNGQVILAAIAGFFAMIALLISSTVLNVSVNAIALGGIVALFGLIPMIGNTISAIIVVLICLLASPQLALIMLIYFLLYQQIENITLQPYVQSRQNELSPLIVFIAAILGIGFGGLLGAFVAIPLASCVKILVEDYFKDRFDKDIKTQTAYKS